jgi:hypothetical protein
MFCSLKYLAALTVLWGIGVSVLALTYSQEQAEIRLLSGREMRLVAKGAGPVPQCTTNSLINSWCNDRYATCPSLPQGSCNGTACTGCAPQTLATSVCNMSTYPWVSLCNVQSNAGACGFYYLNPTCTWSNGACTCWANQTDNNSPCSQPQNTLNNTPCAQVKPL